MNENFNYSVRIDAAQIESNLPGEDRFCSRESRDLKAYCVIDGHGGYLAADICGKQECYRNQCLIGSHVTSFDTFSAAFIRYYYRWYRPTALSTKR